MYRSSSQRSRLYNGAYRCSNEAAATWHLSSAHAAFICSSLAAAAISYRMLQPNVMIIWRVGTHGVANILAGVAYRGNAMTPGMAALKPWRGMYGIYKQYQWRWRMALKVAKRMMTGLAAL